MWHFFILRQVRRFWLFFFLMFLAWFMVLFLFLGIFSFLLSELRNFFLLVLNFLLKILYVSLLISRKLMICRWSNVELEENAILWVCWQIAFWFKLVDSVESIVTPTFSNLELRLVFSSDFGVTASVRNHFYTVLILLRFCWLHHWWALVHFEEDGNIVSVSVLSISIWVNFEAPSYSIRKKRWWVDWIFTMPQLWEVSQFIFTAVIIWHNVTRELNLDWILNIVITRPCIQFLQLSNQFCALLD